MDGPEQAPELPEKQEDEHQEHERYDGDYDRRNFRRDLKGIRCRARYRLLQWKSRDGKPRNHHAER